MNRTDFQLAALASESFSEQIAKCVGEIETKPRTETLAWLLALSSIASQLDNRYRLLGGHYPVSSKLSSQLSLKALIDHELDT